MSAISEAQEVSHAREAEIVPTKGDDLLPLRPADAKVQHIIERMQRLEWDRGKDAPRLAIEWSCSVALVERYSSEASRFLRLIREPELVRAKVLARLTEIGDEDEGDRVPALLGVAKIAGVLEPRQAGPSGGQVPPEQRTASLSAVLRDPSPELARLIQDAVRAGPNGLTAALEACGWRPT